MTLGSEENVEYNILIDGVKAIEQLRELTSHAENFRQKIATVSEQVKRSSREWGMSINATKSVFKELDMIMSGSGEGSVLFGQMHKQGWEEVGKSARRGSSEVVKGIDVIRTALGVLVSMLLFNVIQAFQTAFSTAINNLREFEATLFRISNVEKQLSEQGVDISVEGLRKGIEDIKALLPLFSEEDVSQMIGSLATATSHLGLTEQQIIDLGKAIAFFNVQSVEEESLLQTQAKIVNSIVTAQAKGVGNLGITFSKDAMQDAMKDLGIINKEVSELTDEERTQVKWKIIVDKAGIESVSGLNSYLTSVDAKSQELSATWNDFLRDVAIRFAPLIVEVLQSAIEFLDRLSESLDKNQSKWDTFVAVLAGIQRIQRDINEKSADDKFGKWLSALVPALGAMRKIGGLGGVWDSFLDGFNDAKEYADNFGRAVEHATKRVGDAQDAVDSFDASKFQQEIDDILEDADRAREDIDSKLQDKKEDLDLEYDRKRLDAERDYFRKVEDINRDAEREIANLKEEQREEDLRAEQDYQNKLWELRMRYLLNLEDALHARDARQVIRLMKEYDIDKEALERKKNLDDQQREEDQRDALEDIEIKRQQRLEDARIEYQEKLEDLNIAKQRELDDLAVWYDRELADLQQATQRKLETLLAGWIEEQKLTEANAAQVYGILYKYFGPGGMTDALYQYMMQSMLQAQAAAISAGPGIIGTHPVSPPGGEEDPGHRRGGLQMAEGGTLLATRSTKVEFGEAGPELATFIPLNRIGRDVGKLMSSPGGMGGRGDGKLLVELLLSPDLEARVIEKSMDNVGDVIARVNRTKL